MSVPSDMLSFLQQAPGYSGLDPSAAAKQIAALSNSAKYRQAAVFNPDSNTISPSSATSTSVTSGATPPSFAPMQPPPLSSMISQQPTQQPTTQQPIPGHPQGLQGMQNAMNTQPPHHQAQPQAGHVPPTNRANFLRSVAEAMLRRGTPLPPSITGVQTPSYDPSSTMFSSLEPGAEPGFFRLMGKDIDMTRLWAVVLAAGGHYKLSQGNGWPSIAPIFDLPQTAANSLSQHFQVILGPLEEIWWRNQRLKQMQQAQQGQGSNPPPGANPGTTLTSNGHLGGQPSALPMHTPGNAQTPQSQPELASSPPRPQQIDSPASSNDSRKRKLLEEAEEIDTKRQKTSPQAESPIKVEDSSSQGISASDRPKARHKIEYIPLNYVPITHGGRSVTAIQRQHAEVRRRRPTRGIHEFGEVDIDGLVMSLRSGIAIELSYALTTFTLLSIMSGSQPGTGFPLYMCEDMLDVLLDLLEEKAFGGAEEILTDDENPSSNQELKITTHRQLLNCVNQADSNATFAPPSSSHSPLQTSSEIILSVVGILRNLTMTPENQRNMADSPRTLNVVLRLSSLASTSMWPPTPASPALSLRELIAIRSDTLMIISNLCGGLPAVPHHPEPAKPFDLSKLKPITAQRIFTLILSILTDPAEAVPPSAYMYSIGASPPFSTPHGPILPPALPDLALDIFSRIAQPDANRLIFASIVPIASLLRLANNLVRYLPVNSEDHQACTNEAWLSYLEKVIMGLYHVVALAPGLEVKRVLKRRREVRGVLGSVVRTFVGHRNAEVRAAFAVMCRRAVETLRLVDEDDVDILAALRSGAGDKVEDTTIRFGTDWGDGKGESDIKAGIGLLGSDLSDVLWGMMLQTPDDLVWADLESMVRVDAGLTDWGSVPPIGA